MTDANTPSLAATLREALSHAIRDTWCAQYRTSGCSVATNTCAECHAAKALAVLTALGKMTSEERMEEAVDAALGFLPGAIPATPHERWQCRRALEAAAPLLTAPLVGEIARLREEAGALRTWALGIADKSDGVNAELATLRRQLTDARRQIQEQIDDKGRVLREYEAQAVRLRQPLDAAARERAERTGA